MPLKWCFVFVYRRTKARPFWPRSCGERTCKNWD